MVTAIRESTEYQNFQEAEKKVRSVPGLEEKIREFCRKNYEIQKTAGDDLYERMDAFEKQYREFRRNPVVSQYLESELCICRMIQEIDVHITNAVELMI